MKRFFLSFLMSMALWSTATSQFTLLVEGGANYGKATLFGPDEVANFESSYENITSYFFAVTPKFGILNNLGAFAELQYSAEGYRIEPIDFSSESRRNVHYVRVIPGIEVNILGPISILGGMNVGFVTFEKSVSVQQVSGNTPSFQLFDKTDYGVLLGMNANFLGINLSLKYNLGLKNVSETTLTDIEGNIIGSVETKNRFVQLGLGYEFGL